MASRQESAPLNRTVRRPGADGPDGAQKSQPQGERAQAEAYEHAVEAFQRGDYSAAMKLFEKAAQGPLRDVTHSARLRVNVCSRRMMRRDLTQGTPDEHYDYAIALMNEGKLGQAERHLVLALAHAPAGDHLYYALALCHGLGGDITAAHTNLKRAIELHPRNRIAARNDPDFTDIAKHPAIAALLYPEPKSS